MTKPIVANLARMPQKASLSYKWADYIELLCLVNPDGEISRSDVLDRLQEGRGSGQTIDDDAESISSRFGIASVSESSDRDIRRVEDWFRHLDYRSRACEGFYPFSLGGDGSVLQRLEPTQQHYLYIFLLLAANLGYVGLMDRGDFAYDFELVSKAALVSYMSPASEVHIFGKNPRNKGRYTGHLWNKINCLAADIGETAIYSRQAFDPQNTGDEGVDLVAWGPLGDVAGALLVVLGQCACTEQWDEKQYSSHAIHWRNFISFKALPINFVFIPGCFRQANGAWFRPYTISDSVIFDRVRLLYTLKSADYGPCCVIAEKDIAGAFDTKEDLV